MQTNRDVEALKNKIYNHLGDELSKKIFEFRWRYSETGNIRELDGMFYACWDNIGRYEQVRLFGKKLDKLSDKNLYLFGAGNYSRLLIYLFPEIKWKIIDNNIYGGSLAGVPILAFSELKKGNENCVVITSKKYYEEMYKQLACETSLGAEDIIDATFLFDLIEGKQYFDLPELTLVEDEIFVDAGCFDGQTSLDFVEWSNGKYKSVYCFEPDADNQRKIYDKTKNIDIHNFNVVKKGLWDKKTYLSFISNGSGMSKIVEDDRNGLDKVCVTSLDEELKDIQVTFIKMDIEGSELKALQGARHIIERCRPKLAICVYHKYEDIYRIPEFVLGIHSDYKIYFRHYGFTESETVMYAI
jgi:FkbM family methyltransferase